MWQKGEGSSGQCNPDLWLMEHVSGCEGAAQARLKLRQQDWPWFVAACACRHLVAVWYGGCYGWFQLMRLGP